MYRWLTNTWKDAQHHSLSEKCKSKPQWGTISCQSEWLPSKSLQKITAGEGVEKREPSYTVGGKANKYSHYVEQCGDSLKNWKQNCHMTQQSQWWAYTLRKPELKETLVPWCSFTIARTWKQPRCPLAYESCGTYTQWNIIQLLKRMHLNQFWSLLYRVKWVRKKNTDTAY